MKEIKFVDVGEGITEGHIRKWLVKSMDTVKEDQPVVQVETDKAVVNVPSPINGTIRVVAGEDSTVKVGDVIAYIGEPSEISAQSGITPQAQAPAPAAKQALRTPPPAAAAPEAVHEVLATPSVRKLARDLGVDLTKTVGTGPNGHITENDIRSFKGAMQKKVIPKFSEVLEKQHGEEITRIPMTQTRKAIARNMELSWTIPRAVHMDLLNAASLSDIVQREKPKLQQLGIHLTFLPFIIKAVVEALKDNPRFNSSYDHDRQEIIVKKYFNIGVAAEAPDGLKVLVIKNADTKSIAQIAKELQELSTKVKEQTITIEEMSDSTFTITNIGSLGGGFLSVPMINYPEVAILGVQRIRDAAVVVNGQIVVGKELPISLCFDHRVVDGADTVAFANMIKQYLEDPDFLEILG